MADVFLPVTIMLLVLTEVALWQWRVLLTARGRRALPAALGVLGAILQVTAIAQVVTNLADPLTVAAYATGVGGGVLIGVIAGTRFSAEPIEVKVVTTDADLGSHLRLRGWPVIAYAGHGGTGPVHVLHIVVPARQRPALAADVDELAPRGVRTHADVTPGAAVVHAS